MTQRFRIGDVVKYENEKDVYIVSGVNGWYIRAATSVFEEVGEGWSFLLRENA